MFKRKATCCISLKIQVVILSVIDVVAGLTLSALVIHAFYPALIYVWEVEIYPGYIVPFIFAVGAFMLQVLLASVLVHGARKKKRLFCRIWLLASTLLLILKSITFIVHLVTGNHDHDAVSYGLLIDIVYKLYQIPIVIFFMVRELQDDVGQVMVYSKSELETV